MTQVEKKGAWWEREQVRSLNISAPHTVLPSLTIGSALGNTANNCTSILQYYIATVIKGWMRPSRVSGWNLAESGGDLAEC